MEITQGELDTIMHQIKRCCQNNNCVKCMYSLKVPDSRFDYEISYRCLASIDGVDPWQWDLGETDSVSMKEKEKEK